MTLTLGPQPLELTHQQVSYEMGMMRVRYLLTKTALLDTGAAAMLGSSAIALAFGAAAAVLLG